MLANYHTHTDYCDGKSSAEEIVLSAISLGLSAIGFSGHGYTDFDLSYCMKDTEGYINEILRLKDRYKGKIDILLGVEEDARCPVLNRERFDYVIGSSHYSYKKGIYFPIDSSVDRFKECLDSWGGDLIAFAKEYYDTFSTYVEKRKPDIVGHFDLITKYDEVGGLGLLNNGLYDAVAIDALNRILDTGCMIEVNTGAIARGYRSIPYPSDYLLSELNSLGVGIVLTSDCHHPDNLDFAYDLSLPIIKAAGYRSIYNLTPDGFCEFEI